MSKLDEIEKSARRAHDVNLGNPSPWKYEYDEPYCSSIYDAKGRKLDGIQVWLDDAPVEDYNAVVDANAKHIATSDPKTVLKMVKVLKAVEKYTFIHDNICNMRITHNFNDCSCGVTDIKGSLAELKYGSD